MIIENIQYILIVSIYVFILLLIFYILKFLNVVNQLYDTIKYALRIQYTCNINSMERETARSIISKYIDSLDILSYSNTKNSFKNIYYLFVLFIIIYHGITYRINRKFSINMHFLIIILVIPYVISLFAKFINKLPLYFTEYKSRKSVLQQNLFVPTFLLQNEIGKRNNTLPPNINLVKLEEILIKRILQTDQLDSYEQAYNKYIDIINTSSGNIIDYIKFDMSTDDYKLLKYTLGNIGCIADDFNKLNKSDLNSIFNYMCTFDSNYSLNDFMNWRTQLVNDTANFHNGVPISNYFKNLDYKDNQWNIWSIINNTDDLNKLCINNTNPLNLNQDSEQNISQSLSYLSSLNNGLDSNVQKDSISYYIQLYIILSILAYILFHIFYSLNSIMLVGIFYLVTLLIIFIGSLISNVM